MDPTRRGLSERQQNATVLKQHYITPAEVQVPALKGKDVVHRAVSVKVDPTQQAPGPESLKYELDGFFMLEATGMGFPEDAQQALLADRKLVSVVEDDMSYFTEMLYIDASENNLQFAPFGAFPKLRELHLACNLISYIPPELFGFANLTALDLSYNHLSSESIHALEVLPNLKDLDLSGNKLKEIPDDWQHYRSLEKLLLDYNLLENNDIFTYISSAPNLRILSVFNNHLSVFPDVALAFDGFRVLDTLDLACNYFTNEQQLEPATRIPRISIIKLYGNPVLGESGEDPLYIYIEGLVDDSIAHREAHAPHLPNIDFMTEFPKPKTMKKGQPLGRQANYRDFAIVQVDSGADQTQRAWRERGNQTIFAETMAKRRKGGDALAASLSTASLPDTTFLTSSHAVGTTHSTNHNHAHGHHHHGHGHGNDKSHDVVADDVMQRVAGDMGLVTSAELLMLRDKAGVQSSVLDFLKRDLPLEIEEDEEFEIAMQEHGDAEQQRQQAVLTPETRRTLLHQRLQQEHANSLQQRMQDQVPGGLFKQTMGETSVLAPQPVALKTALKALQQAIAQPLSNYDELPSKSAMFPSKDYYKPTRSSVLRQMPRHVLGEGIPGTGNLGQGLGDSKDSAEEDAAEMARYVGVKGNATGGRGNKTQTEGNANATGNVSNGASVQSQRAGSPPRKSAVGGARGTSSGAAAEKSGSAKPGNTGPTPRRPAATATGMENPDLPANRYLHRGLKESSTVRALRQEQRNQTLEQIDDVLQNLNAHTTGWSEKQTLQAIKNANNRGHAAKSEKETMREMRDFAQPFTGVKSLLSMVQDIEAEFNS